MGLFRGGDFAFVLSQDGGFKHGSKRHDSKLIALATV